MSFDHQYPGSIQNNEDTMTHQSAPQRPSHPAENSESTTGGACLHMGLAEQGKVHALAGDHAKAMVYYREAIRMVTTQSAPEVFFRHYLECLLESLELMGAYKEVVGFCERAIQYHGTLKPVSDEQAAFMRYDLAHLHQRLGVIQYKQGLAQEARESFQKALNLARQGAFSLPLTDALYGWAVRGFRTDARRIAAEQERFAYFSVRRDTVDPKRAISLPETHLQALQLV